MRSSGIRVGGECAQGRARVPACVETEARAWRAAEAPVCVCVCVCVCLGFITVLERLEVRPRVCGGRKLRGAFVFMGFS